MSTQEKIAVKFVKHWRGYNAGEVAGFDSDLAQRLQDGGVAEKHGGGGSKATKARGDKTPAQAPAAPPADQVQGAANSDPDDGRP